MSKVQKLLAVVTVSCLAWGASTASAEGSQSSPASNAVNVVRPDIQTHVGTGPIIVPPAPAPTPGG
jgi:hypothetical protein